MFTFTHSPRSLSLIKFQHSHDFVLQLDSRNALALVECVPLLLHPVLHSTHNALAVTHHFPDIRTRVRLQVRDESIGGLAQDVHLQVEQFEFVRTLEQRLPCGEFLEHAPH